MPSATPRRRAPNQTRTRVLESAGLLFSERGFSGTSMRDIARRSGVSQPLIHHHFGSKRALYRAVQGSIFERYRREVHTPGPGDPPESPESFAARELRGIFRFCGRHSRLLRLAAWSRLEEDRSFWPGERELLQTAIEKLGEPGRAEEVPSGVDPRVWVLVAMASSDFWWSHRETYQRLFDDSASPGEVDRHFFEELRKLLLGDRRPPKPPTASADDLDASEGPFPPPG